MIHVLIFLNSLLGFALGAVLYTFHKEGKTKEALLTIGLLTLNIANVAFLTLV